MVFEISEMVTEMLFEHRDALNAQKSIVVTTHETFLINLKIIPSCQAEPLHLEKHMKEGICFKTTNGQICYDSELYYMEIKC